MRRNLVEEVLDVPNRVNHELPNVAVLDPVEH